ncbi:Type II/IV secretion system protein TadC, associated with Flp pilus assembly [hydrothermal vent metagenome]|uniref:Type II/IV secretion system protein TadC, associated with Flp pilus assembly n=1 Tax=hydrothermal vent metagenome TaxID=652676 RepID=A0A3B1D447_9ZZZZ
MNLASWTILIAAESLTFTARISNWLREIYAGNYFRVIYLVLAVLIVTLIVRILFRKKTKASVDGIASSLETTSTETTAKEYDIRPIPSIVSKNVENVSWKDRELFGKTRQRLIDQENPVPELLAEDSPVLNNDDLTFGTATPTLAAMLPQSEESRDVHKRELQKAGYYKPRAWQNLAAVRYLGIIVPLFFFGILFLFLPVRYEWIAAVLVVVIPIAGWALPSLFIKGKATDRLSEIETGMPDMLDMMNMCIGQGLTVKESLYRVSKDLKPVYPALAQELSIVHEQAEVGTMRHALENFADRIDTPPVKSFTSLLIQTDEMGTSVSDALEDHSDSMRETLRQRADEKANSSAFKLLFPTVLCLMPAVFIILLGPAIISLSDFYTEGGFDSINSGRNAIRQIETLR